MPQVSSEADSYDNTTTKVGAVERADGRRPLQNTCELIGPYSEIAKSVVGADGCRPADRRRRKGIPNH